MKKALVLGNVSRAILAVIRSLGRGGVQPHLAWHDPACVSLWSRYAHRTHHLPPYSPTDDAWKTALCQLMQREKFDLVLPCSDVDTLACQRHREELGQYGRLYVPNPAACAVFFDKLKTNELARAVGVRIPREIVVTEAQPATALVAELGLPLVLKPRRTFDPEQPEMQLKVHKAYTIEDFHRLLPPLLEFGPVAVQENFLGQGAGVELLLNAGEPMLAFQHLRVHEPLQGGQSTYRQSTALTPELLDAAVRLLRAVQYHGVAMVEFKLNSATGRWVFIEVNARFWGSLPLAVAAGADFPLALYQFLVEGRTHFPQQYRQGLYCRNLTLDLEWQLANLCADRTDPTLATQPLRRVLSEALGNLLCGRERFDTATLDDPGPFLAECWSLTRRVVSRLGKRLSRKRRRRSEFPVTTAQETLAC
jgi:predicted ATP-grasp superfamily ATP-dependent carboligase